jgi:hypothetical protein
MLAALLLLQRSMRHVHMLEPQQNFLPSMDIPK